MKFIIVKLLSYSIFLVLIFSCKKKSSFRFENGYYNIVGVFNYGTDSTLSINSINFVGSKNYNEGHIFKGLINDTLFEIQLMENEPRVKFLIVKNGQWTNYSSSVCSFNLIEKSENYVRFTFDTITSNNSIYSNGSLTIQKN